MTDVEQVKSKIDIVSYINEHVPLKKTGRNFAARCPFHSEKTPSFFVSAERQSWYCFGACSEGGDIFTFVQKRENVDFTEALKILAQKAGVTLTHAHDTGGSSLKEKLLEINHVASEFYHYLLTNHNMGKRAMAYLKDRGIKPETIKTFVLGYAPSSWDSLFKYLLKKGYQAADIATAALVISRTGGGYYDRFRGRLIFTLKDHRGNIVGFSGRVLPGTDDPPAGQQGAKYININETPVYVKGNILYGLDVTREAIKKQKEAVVVEGEFDLLASFQSGVANVVAIKGSALTSGHLMLLLRFTDKLNLALDSDFAGNEAARRGIEAAEQAGFSVRVVIPAYGKDPAECVAKAPHLWKQSVAKAVPLYDFIIDTAVAKYGKEGVAGKKNIADEAVPFLATISNPIVASHYVRKLAALIEVSEESVMALSSRFVKVSTTQKPSQQTATTFTRQRLLEEQLLALIIQHRKTKEALAKTTSILSFSDFDTTPVAKILKLLSGYLHKRTTFAVGEFGKL